MEEHVVLSQGIYSKSNLITVLVSNIAIECNKQQRWINVVETFNNNNGD